MSGTFEKKADGATRRLERAQKESREKRKVRVIAVSVVAVLALLFAGALFINSVYVRRTLPAMTIGGVNFTAVEFDYFYNNAYHEYREMAQAQMPDLVSMMPTGRPFTHQMNPLTGEPWSDTFTELAVANMSELVQYHNAARAAGFVLSAEQRIELEDQINMFVMESSMYGFPTFDSFLQALFGNNINEASFRKIVEFAFTATTYSDHMRETFTYTPGELAAYYAENRDTLDTFTYRYFHISAETTDRQDFDTEEEYDLAVEVALADALALAELIQAGIEDENDFIEAAFAYNESQFEEPDSTLASYPGSWLGSHYGPWMMESGRQYGDVFTMGMTTGAYVVFFIERDSNSYLMPEMRQILILRDQIDPYDFMEMEDDPEYQTALENAEIEARDRAEAVLDLFVAGGATEAALLEMLEDDHSDDPIEGGFYDQISKSVAQNKMVSEIEDWLFSPERRYGDYELIRTEDYGFHLVFFMGFGERFSDFLAESRMRNNDYNEWRDGLEPVEAVKRWAFVLTQQ